MTHDTVIKIDDRTSLYEKYTFEGHQILELYYDKKLVITTEQKNKKSFYGPRTKLLWAKDRLKEFIK